MAGVRDRNRSLDGLGTDESVWLGCAELGHLGRARCSLQTQGGSSW